MVEIEFLSQTRSIQMPQGEAHYATTPFYRDGVPLEGAPICALSLKDAGSMRYRYSEDNPNRKAFLTTLSKDYIQVELGHTKDIVVVEDDRAVLYGHDNSGSPNIRDVSLPLDKEGVIADGILVHHRKPLPYKEQDGYTGGFLLPVLTVADCLPIYLYGQDTYGTYCTYCIVHSGWKGTGIVTYAIDIMLKRYKISPKDICAVIGPSIHECCYIVGEERAALFKRDYGKECIAEYTGDTPSVLEWNKGRGRLYRLSLQKANIALLRKAGIPEGNIVCARECTSCDTRLGSYRRECGSEGALLATVMAAFILPCDKV